MSNLPVVKAIVNIPSQVEVHACVCAHVHAQYRHSHNKTDLFLGKF